MKINNYSLFLVAASAAAILCSTVGHADAPLASASSTKYQKQWERALEPSGGRGSGLASVMRSRNKDKALESLQTLSGGSNFDTKRENAEAWIFDYVLPQWAERFDKTVTFYGLTIRQDHELINLERSPWSRIIYQDAVRVGSTEMALPPVLLVDPPTPMRNAARLFAGEAPYGPDNSPVRVCALLSGANPIYYEMREGEVALAMSAMRHPQPTLSCLDPEIASAYWRQRRGDFIGKLGVEKSPPRDH